MIVKEGPQERHYRTIWMEENTVKMIDQRLLPNQFSIFHARTLEETCIAIKDMTVRGAGAIGAAAGYAMAQAAHDARDKGTWFSYWMAIAENMIKSTRPTAQNLFYAVERVKKAINIKNFYNFTELANLARAEAESIAHDDEEACKKIGELGESLVTKLGWTKDKDTITILTHCNAGWLAFVDYGTALSPIYEAKRLGKKIRVLSDATTPRYQGAKLTCWELQNEGIEHYLIPDTASGYLMSKGEVDLVIVGADRIAENGDVANKIGTFQVATMANYFKIPFYVAAPTSTIDLKLNDGSEIPIEYRSEDEVTCVEGCVFDRNGKLQKMSVQIPPFRTSAINPAFDVTPNEMITKIITEKGILDPSQIKFL